MGKKIIMKKSIKQLHKKEIQEAKNNILSNIEYLIRAYVQIELDEISRIK